MNPAIALSLCLFFIACVLYMERRRQAYFSSALWIPLIWFMIAASRPVAFWFSPDTSDQPISSFESGNPIDRAILIVLMVMSLIILWKRKMAWRDFINANKGFALLFLYAGLSVLWSDFPLVAAKRYIRGFGTVLAVLVVLTEAYPAQAIESMVRKLCLILVPLSICFFKYFPSYGVTYGYWSGERILIGVTTDKNALGRLCLISAFMFFTGIARQFRSKIHHDKTGLMLNAFMLFLSSWVLVRAESATSLATMFIGVMIYVWLRSPGISDHLRKAWILMTVFLFSFLFITMTGLDVQIIKMLGRDPTLTGRTDIWDGLLNMGTSPLFGTGYESFWLGKRLVYIWSTEWGHITEAHNGYLETYLSLGFLGLLFLLIFLYNSLYNIVADAANDPSGWWRARASLFFMILIYNFSESGFGGTHLIWLMLLLIGLNCSYAPSYRLVPVTARY